MLVRVQEKRHCGCARRIEQPHDSRALLFTQPPTLYTLTPQPFTPQTLRTGHGYRRAGAHGEEKRHLGS